MEILDKETARSIDFSKFHDDTSLIQLFVDRDTAYRSDYRNLVCAFIADYDRFTAASDLIATLKDKPARETIREYFFSHEAIPERVKYMKYAIFDDDILQKAIQEVNEYNFIYLDEMTIQIDCKTDEGYQLIEGKAPMEKNFPEAVNLWLQAAGNLWILFDENYKLFYEDEEEFFRLYGFLIDKTYETYKEHIEIAKKENGIKASETIEKGIERIADLYIQQSA